MWEKSQTPDDTDLEASEGKNGRYEQGSKNSSS